MFAGSVGVLPLRGQVVQTSPTPAAQTGTAQSEAVSGESALIFSPAVVPLPADLTPTGNGLITSAFGPNPGPFQYAVHLTLRAANDDNIGLTHSNPIDDSFMEIQPCVLVGIGDLVKQDAFLAAIYIPSFYRYEEHSEFDSNQHVGHLIGGLTSGKLTLRLSQDVAIRDNIVLAATSGERAIGTVTGRTNLDTYNTRVSANYNMTSNDFLFTEFKANMTEYAAPLVSSQLYAGDLYLNHGFTSQFVLGVGAEVGYNPVDFPAPDQRMVQANLHMNYTPSKKFAVDLIAGEEFRFFDTGSRGSYDTPVFSFSAAFTPNDDIRFGLTATRQVYNSAASLHALAAPATATAQDYVDNSVNGLLRGHVCKPLYLTLLGGYEHVQYFNTINLSPPLFTLTDDYYYVQPSLDVVVTRYWVIGGYYLHRQNSGSVTSVGFKSNEYGLRTTIKF